MTPASLVDVIFFISDRRIGVLRPDTGEEGYPVFAASHQAYWQLGYLFPDGRQAVLWSQEPPRNPHAAFDDPDGLGHATTHLWRCDFVAGTLWEIGLPSSAQIIGLVPDGQRFVVMENVDQCASLFTADLDGGRRDIIYASPGYAYGAALSPEGDRVAFHIVGAPDLGSYTIRVASLTDRTCTLIAGDPRWLYFGPSWSPDGQWLLYQACDHAHDPGHDRADLCISRVDGTAHRQLTQGQALWFAAAMGTPERHSSGSNGPAWSPDGRIACTPLLPGAHTAWPYRVGQPDRDHFNRDYRPELARGGTQLCLLDPANGAVTPLTHDEPPTWYVRPAWSPDGSHLVVGRADVGQQLAMWLLRSDGSQRRYLTRGIHDTGADHFRYRQLTTDAANNLFRMAKLD